MMAKFGLSLSATAVLAVFFPRAVAIPFAVLGGWIGISLLVRAWKLKFRPEADDAPPASSRRVPAELPRGKGDPGRISATKPALPRQPHAEGISVDSASGVAVRPIALGQWIVTAYGVAAAGSAEGSEVALVTMARRLLRYGWEYSMRPGPA